MPKIGEELTERLLTVEAYREAAFANGIPFRPNGLFPMGDSLLAELSSKLHEAFGFPDGALGGMERLEGSKGSVGEVET